MQYLSNNKITNQRVILRCDFNVPVKDNKIMDDNRIQKSFKTINYLLENNNKVLILSHFGRVKKEEDKENNSLYIVYEYLKKYYDLEFINNPLDLSKVNSSNKNIFLIENTRYTDVPNKRESANDLALAKYWASFADCFVLDAFGSMHRLHASTAGLSTYLPTYYGFLVEEEIKNLEPLKGHIDLAIMGGAKADDKITIIASLLKKCDHLLITGGILNTFLKVMGYNVGQSLVAEDEDVLEQVKSLIEENKGKIIYSEKFVVKRGNDNLVVDLKEIKNNDIIYDNIIDFENIIQDSKRIFLNGTCGMCESDAYQRGTKELFNMLISSHNEVYVGGGDTVSFINNWHLTPYFKYLSSGGGATLEYVANNTLSTIQYIEK